MYRKRDNNFDTNLPEEGANARWKEFAGTGDVPPSLDHRRASVAKKYYTPSQEQLDLLLPVPIRCFCNQPAHKTYTAEYGPIYECASFDHDNIDSSKFQSRYICGFHIHERSWTKLVEDLRRGKDINLEFLELRTCPQYNFTFCSIFKVANSYSLASPTKLPVCFCRRPVTMRITRQGFIQFGCKNGLVEGAKKCSWVLPSNEVAFPKPKTRLHSLMEQEQYWDQREEKREELSKTDHKTHLLATLVGNGPSTSQQQEKISSPIDSPLISSPPQISKDFIVPTSVMVKKQQKARQISPSTSSVSSNTSTPVMRPINYSQDQNDEELLKQRDYIAHLQSVIEKLKQNQANNTSVLREQLAETKEKMLELQTDLYRMRNEKLEERIFTVNCQERLGNIELDVVRLMNENQKLTDENLSLRAQNIELTTIKEDEPNKCIVCYTQTIDCCLKPCYHYAYCQTCAVKLTSCAICRRPVKSVQKIYQS